MIFENFFQIRNLVIHIVGNVVVGVVMEGAYRRIRSGFKMCVNLGILYYGTYYKILLLLVHFCLCMMSMKN